ncbi:MAG: alkaline phosphatase family protein [Promethearchaeota archaeon]|jgi:predicted AlkP superfamily phosphohydrolase/phosphomutase
MKKVIVIGIDAGSWNLIDPWIKNNTLPILKKLVENGVSGNLESCIPFITSPAWKCYSTGKNPGRLGAFYWFDFDREKKEIKLCSSLSFKSKEIWDYLSESGYRCGIINMPLTYPPKEVNGIMISGIHAFDQSEYTYPPQLKQWLKKEYNYSISPSHHFLEKEKILNELTELFKNRFRIAGELFKRENLDFLHLTIFAIDGIQHYYWDTLKQDPENNIILTLWKAIDSGIGHLLNSIENEIHSNYNLFIISDHGATRTKNRYNINMWLLENGFLFFKNNFLKNNITRELFEKIGLTKGRLAVLYKKYSKIIGKFIHQEDILIKGFGQHFFDEAGEIGITALLEEIDWDKTKAIVIGEGLLYLNIHENSGEYDITRNSLLERIEKITDPDTGEKIAFVLKKEHVYEGKYLNTAPDLLLVPTDGYLINDYISKEGNFWSSSRKKFTACHTLHGIFLAYGPHIKKNMKIHNAKIYDITPTILHLFHIPSPPDIDGHVLTNIFK